MPAQLTTRQQVNGYRFLLRRYEHALVRRDVRMLHDPMRSQSRSMIVGAVLALLVVAGAAILAFLRPQGAIGDAKIVMTKDNGALYVVVNETLHPVLNLSSARLIAGSNEQPTSVKSSKLSDLPRGPMLGIPGAPAMLPGSSAGDRSTWTLCDTVELSDAGRATTRLRTTVIAGALNTDAQPAARPLAGSDTLLVSKGDKSYLVYDGKRAELDTRDPVVARTLDLNGRTPRPVSAGVLNSTTQVPALAPPRIEGRGGSGPGALSAVPVGGVIRVRGVVSDDLYVVLADGVQAVSPFAAELIRTSNSQEMKDIVTVPPDRLVGVPVLKRLPVDEFPVQIPTVVAAEDAPVACTSWARGKDDAAATVTVLAGRALPLRDSAKPVALATSDGAGDRVDAAYIPPGTGEYVQVTGMDPASERRGTLFYVAENGIRFGVPSAEVAAVLGLEARPRLAPWPIIGQLVPGPTLNPQDALVSHDTLPTGGQ